MSKGKAGRPMIHIDQRQFEALVSIPFANLERVAAVLGCSADTVERWCKRTFKVDFAEIKAQKTSGMKLKLAGKQYEMAMKGSIPMMIWLGKQDLGQSEKLESKVEAKVEDITYKASWGGRVEIEDKDA